MNKTCFSLFFLKSSFHIINLLFLSYFDSINPLSSFLFFAQRKKTVQSCRFIVAACKLSYCHRVFVFQITQDDIRKTYGGSSGSRGYYSSAFARCVKPPSPAFVISCMPDRPFLNALQFFKLNTHVYHIFCFYTPTALQMHTC